MKLGEMITLFGSTLEEAQKLISANHNEQRAFLTVKFRAKARMTHPDKAGTHDEMKMLNLSREWLTTAAHTREALVQFINTEKSRRERELKKRAEEEQREQATARLEAFCKKLEEEERGKTTGSCEPEGTS